MILFPISALAVLQARSYLELSGSQERPNKSNEGFWIDECKQMFWGASNWAWCMYFVQAMLEKSYEILGPILNVTNPFDDMQRSQRGHCMSVWRYALSDDRLSTIPVSAILAGEKIPRHSIFIIGRPDDTGHTWFTVTHWQNDYEHKIYVIKTMEGNKSNRVGTDEYFLKALMKKGFKGVIY